MGTRCASQRWVSALVSGGITCNSFLLLFLASTGTHAIHIKTGSPQANFFCDFRLSVKKERAWMGRVG